MIVSLLTDSDWASFHSTLYESENGVVSKLVRPGFLPANVPAGAHLLGSIWVADLRLERAFWLSELALTKSQRTLSSP